MACLPSFGHRGSLQLECCHLICRKLTWFHIVRAVKEQAAEAAKAQAAKATNGESKAGKQEPVAEKPKPQVPLQNALDRTPHELQVGLV